MQWAWSPLWEQLRLKRNWVFTGLMVLMLHFLCPWGDHPDRRLCKTHLLQCPWKASHNSRGSEGTAPGKWDPPYLYAIGMPVTWRQKELEGEEDRSAPGCPVSAPLLLMGTVPLSSFAAGDIRKRLMLSHKSWWVKVKRRKNWTSLPIQTLPEPSWGAASRRNCWDSNWLRETSPELCWEKNSPITKPLHSCPRGFLWWELTCGTALLPMCTNKHWGILMSVLWWLYWQGRSIICSQQNMLSRQQHWMGPE